MRVKIEAVLSAGRRESVELEVEADSKVRDLKEVLCKKYSLISDDHVLERILHVPMPGGKELEFDSTGKLAYTGRDAIVRTPTPIDEDKTLAEHQVSSADELVLAWKRDAHTRCKVCGRRMTVFAEQYGHGCCSELLICSECNRADWILIGEHNEFGMESSGNILWESGDLLLVRNMHDVTIYELYGQPEFSLIAGNKVRRHRTYCLVDPRLEALIQGRFIDRVKEVLLSRRESPCILESLLALRILGAEPRDSAGKAERLVSRLRDYKASPGPGGSPDFFLSHLTDDLECLGSVGVTPDSCESKRLSSLVLSLRNPDGGWAREIALVHDKHGEVEDPPGSGWRFRIVPRSESNTTRTFLALKALDCLSVHIEKEDRTVRSIQSLQNADGGFKSCNSGVAKSFISCTFEAVEALHLLRERPRNHHQCVKWLLTHQRSDGGFGDDPREMDWSAIITGGKKETVQSRTSLRQTYYANKALSTLNATPNDTVSCVNYVMNQRTRFGFGNGTSSDVFHALSILGLLEAVKEVNGLE
jgi:hypothetical protein